MSFISRRAPVVPPRSPRTPLLHVRALGQEIAFTIGQVERVVRYETPVLLATPGVVGRVALRGAPTPILDLAAQFGAPPQRARFRARLVVLRTMAGPAAVLVDIVHGVVAHRDDDLRPADPGLDFAAVTGVCERGDARVRIIDVDQLYTNAHRAAFDQRVAETPGDG